MLSIASRELTVRCSVLGGELQSIRDNRTGFEYLWQADRAYWGRRALNLFPFIGRLWEKRYLLDGKSYPMQIHGFLPNALMEQERIAPDRCRFVLRDSAQTYECYPFRFLFAIEYRLRGPRLEITFEVHNRSDRTLFCAMGGHPGFNLPMEDWLYFEDYELRFPEPCSPKLVELSPGVLCTGRRIDYPLLEGRRLPLRHDLFTQDAVVLADAPRQVELCSPRGHVGVRVEYPQMPYVGFWHKPNSDAPYLCIEPWSALPGRDGVVEELKRMADLWTVPPGQTLRNDWAISILRFCSLPSRSS